MNNLLLCGAFGWGEMLIIAFVILLLFGGRNPLKMSNGSSPVSGSIEVSVHTARPV